MVCLHVGMILTEILPNKPMSSAIGFPKGLPILPTCQRSSFSHLFEKLSGSIASNDGSTSSKADTVTGFTEAVALGSAHPRCGYPVIHPHPAGVFGSNEHGFARVMKWRKGGKGGNERKYSQYRYANGTPDTFVQALLKSNSSTFGISTFD